MERLRNHGDLRQTGACAYCAAGTETHDHVPSKVFLDEPYPADLPWVWACGNCNNSFSPHEVYLACLIECVLAGSTEPERLARAKIAACITRTPGLQSRLARALTVEDGGTTFSVEHERVRTVIMKLSRGHAVYELNEPQFEDPSSCTIIPLSRLDTAQIERFEASPAANIWPEVGSRAMQRMLIVDNRSAFSDWVTVQDGLYRYMAVVAAAGIVVRVVLREYLACEVVWEF